MSTRKVSPQAINPGWKSKIPHLILVFLLGIVLIIIPFFFTEYVQTMIMKVFVFAILAISLNILWGYTGLFSLGHAVFFGLAGYTAGILSVRAGVESFWIAGFCGVLFSTIIAAALGILALRVGGIYFLLVTLAFGELFSNLALKLRRLTGGSNGTTNIQLPDLGIPLLEMNEIIYYYFTFVIFIVCLVLIYRFVKSPFGKVLQGIRENESRMIALGYNVWLHKYIAFIVAAIFSAVSGILFAYYNGVMAPVHLGVMTSTAAMLMVIIGSCSTVFGPALGAAIVVLLEHLSSLYTPERWPMILGGVFVIAVVFLPGGLGIFLSRFWRKVFSGSLKN